MRSVRASMTLSKICSPLARGTALAFRARIQLPPDTDVNSVRRKLTHDLFYIKTIGPWLDVRLLFCTAFYALGVPYSALTRLLGIPASMRIEASMRSNLGEVVPIVPRVRLAACRLFGEPGRQPSARRMRPNDWLRGVHV